MGLNAKNAKWAKLYQYMILHRFPRFVKGKTNIISENISEKIIVYNSVYDSLQKIYL